MKIKVCGFSLLLFLFTPVLSVGIAQTPSTRANNSKAAPSLTAAQLQMINSIRAESEKKAAPVVLRLAATTKQIYENMLSDKEDDSLRQKLSRELNAVAAELLTIKGQSIRDIVGVLTPEERQLIRREMQKPDGPADLSELIMRVFQIPQK